MSGFIVAEHAALEYTPNFWNPRKAYLDFVPDVASAYQEGVQYKLDNHSKPARDLMIAGVRHTIMLTDLQEGFRDNGELPVKGTNDVVLRIAARIINGIINDFYTNIVYSLDGHPVQHISFDYYWRDANGNPLDLSKHGGAACLTLTHEGKYIFKAYGFNEDGTTYTIGYYRAQFDPDDSVAYWKHLQATGQGDIWVFVPHCIIGTKGANLHPLLMEVIAFAAGVRSIQPTIVNKGHIYSTDWFGPLVPCRPSTIHPQGGFQKQIVDDAFKPADTVEFAGVAGDFCDFYMKKQTMEYLEGTEHLGKLRFIKDGTAYIIPNQPHVAKLNAEAEQKDIVFIFHDEPFK